ncbi:MAG TPA: MBL fold metallo-hydrolase [Bacteriovoracaceae bacterium]|nr:MBL fold metallo-hydrolase [Bacteriovoracaceae bacterium]
MKKYFALHPAVFKLDGGAMFGIIPKPLWSKAIPADELNRIELSLRVMLIQTPTKNILIDTGIGDYHGTKFDNRFGIKGIKNPLIQILAEDFALGPSDITDLIVTHLHFDHVGGLGESNPEHAIIFPKAILHVHRSHYQYALNPTPRDTGSFHAQYFRPMIEAAEAQGLVHWVDGEEGVVLEDIRFRCSHGHTPFLLHPYDDKFIYMADLVPTSHHIPVAWVMGYDIAPGRTTIDKIHFYNFIIEKNLTMIFEHDMGFWGAKLGRHGTEDFFPENLCEVTTTDHRKFELSFD